MYRILYNLYANINNKNYIKLGYECISLEDNKTIKFITNTEAEELFKKSLLLGDNNDKYKESMYIEVLNIINNNVTFISNFDTKWLKELNKSGYDISKLILPKEISLEYHICDYSGCNKKIYLGDKCVTDNIHPAYYCSYEHMILDQNLGKSIIMDRNILNEIKEYENKDVK